MTSLKKVLPQSGRTRDELLRMIEEKGSLSESEVLGHINRLARVPWTHEDFENFFQKSCQKIFEVREGRLFKAASESNDDFSRGSIRDKRVPSPERPANRQGNTTRGDVNERSRRLSEDLVESLQAMEAITKRTHKTLQSSDSDDALNEKSSINARKLELPTTMTFELSDDDDDSSPTYKRAPSSSARSKYLIVAPPVESDDDEVEVRRFTTKDEVFRHAYPRKRFVGKSEIENMVTMDPDPENRIAPTINLDSSDDENNSDSDSDSDSDDKSSDVQKPSVKRETCHDSKQSIPAEKKPSFMSGGSDSVNKKRHEPSTNFNQAAKFLQGTEDQNPHALGSFFAVKEEMDYTESHQRDLEKILRDIMQYAEVSRDVAQSYLGFFIALQRYDTDCLSNGQLVAGTLILLEADVDREMIQKF